MNNIYKISTLALITVFSVITFNSAFAEMIEESTEVGNTDNNTVESSVVSSYGEESTEVGNTNNAVDSSVGSPYGEESTEVGNPTGSTGGSPFEEESTEVGNPDPTPEPTTPSRRSGSRGGSRIISLAPEGEVLGATTDASCKMLTTFMKQNISNNVEEVKFLQTFLNTMGANLPVTGFFGPMTRQAVNNFQLQYREQILTPWVNLGLHSSSDIATGYVYKTTQYTINKMLCPEAEIVYPTLN